MEDIKLNLDENGKGGFIAMDGEERMGEMVLRVSGHHLIVYHTEVSQKAEGKGLAKKMLTAMVGYARDHRLQVTPLCPYVHAQFKRHPEEYADVWKMDHEKENAS